MQMKGSLKTTRIEICYQKGEKPQKKENITFRNVEENEREKIEGSRLRARAIG